jgi:uncharacterized FlaG/YvyC family protein
MDITAVAHDAALPTAAPVVPVEKSAENREIVQAVKALNATEMFGQENELTFQRDPQTQRMVIRLVDRKTQEVVLQVPAEYVLRLAQGVRS